jgi:hypothetical protein
VLSNLRTSRNDQRFGKRNFRFCFRTWVLAARYSTLRLLLRDHLEVVAFKDDFGENQQRFYENLAPVRTGEAPAYDA